MKIFCAILLSLTLFISLAFTQINEPKKIDEFGKIDSEYLTVKLQQFNLYLYSEPNLIGQILIHNGKDETPGFPYKYRAAISSYLKFYKIKDEQIRVTICESEEKQRTEIWIFPNLQGLKICKNETPNLTKTTLFDSIYYSPEMGSCCLIDEFEDAEYEASLKAFANILKENKSSKAFIFFYLGTNLYWTADKRNKEKAVRELDAPKVFKELVKKSKKIMSENGVESSRFVLINGGYKDSTRNIELWYVPQNGEIPKPKPNYFPRKNSVKREK